MTDDIRACVLTPDYRFAFTWLRDGSVWCVDRTNGAARYLRIRVQNLHRFNRLLRLMCIRPLKTRAALSLEQQQKILDKWLEQHREQDEGVTETF